MAAQVERTRTMNGLAKDDRNSGLKVGDKVKVVRIEDASYLTQDTYNPLKMALFCCDWEYPGEDDVLEVTATVHERTQDIQLSDGVWYVGVEDLIKVEEN